MNSIHPYNDVDTSPMFIACVFKTQYYATVVWRENRGFPAPKKKSVKPKI